MFGAGFQTGHSVQAGRTNWNQGWTGPVGVGWGWSGPDAYVIPNQQGSSGLVSPMELEYKKNSQIYRQNGTDIDEKAIL
jgi:hypothetical protein